MPAENQPTKKISIDEVAKALGVSKTTVSRALSGKGRISEATRGRVRDYIAQAGAEPAVRAQPAARETHNLTMVIPSDFVHLDLPFLRKCMGGICTAAAQRGYDLLLCYVSGADTSQLERQLDCHKMDGVILSRTIQNDPCVELLRRHKMPFVAIGRTEDPAIPQVDNDQAAASQEMTRLLLQLGLRRIALLTGSPSYYVNQDRARRPAGFRRVAGAAGPAHPGAGRHTSGQPLRQRADRRPQPRHFGGPLRCGGPGRGCLPDVAGPDGRQSRRPSPGDGASGRPAGLDQEPAPALNPLTCF